MLTEKQIEAWAQTEYRWNYSSEEESAAINGATWANEQNASAMLVLKQEANITELVEALRKIKDELPENPKLPLVCIIKDISRNALKKYDPK